MGDGELEVSETEDKSAAARSSGLDLWLIVWRLTWG